MSGHRDLALRTRVARLVGNYDIAVEVIRLVRSASGIETEGQDPTGLGAEHESPTAEGGDAQGPAA